MKTLEEIEQLAEKIYFNVDGFEEEISESKRHWIAAYIQCQEDMTEFIRSEIKKAFIHGQGNAQMMEAGLERDEVEEYSNWRMLSINKYENRG